MANVREPLWTAAFVALTVSDLVYFTAAAMVLTVTPFFAESLGAGRLEIGLAMGSFSATTLVARPLVGRWCDRHGRRRFLVAGALAFGALVVAHLLVESVAVLVIARLALGGAEGMFFVAGFAMLADLAPPDRTGEALSLNSLGLYAGFAAGPLLGEALLDGSGFDRVWIVGGALMIAAGAVAARIPETWRPAEPGPPVPMLHPAAIAPGIALFAAIAGASGFLSFAALRAGEVGLETWSIVVAAYGVVVIACRIRFAALPDRVDPNHLMMVALVLVAAGLGLLALATGAVVIVVGAVVLAVGVAFITPAVFAAIFQDVPPAERGAASGTASVFIDLGFGLGPMLVGVVAAQADIPAGFAASTAIALAAVALLAASSRAGARPR